MLPTWINIIAYRFWDVCVMEEHKNSIHKKRSTFNESLFD